MPRRWLQDSARVSTLGTLKINEFALMEFPGLKPWAESCSPSGAKTVPKAPYLRAIPLWAHSSLSSIFRS